MRNQVLPPQKTQEITNNYSMLPAIQAELNRQKVFLKNARHELFKNLYICHTTNYFPKGGVIYPRLGYNLPEETQPIMGEDFSAAIHTMFSILRPTVHFSLNSVASAHSDHSGFDEGSYIIMDALSSASQQIIGGYIEDMFAFGPYTLSSDAAILVPEGRKGSIQADLEALPSTIDIVYYSNTAQEAVAGFLKAKNAHYLNSRGIQSNNDVPVFYAQLGNKLASGCLIMEKIKAKFCTHDITPLAQLESLFAGNSVINEYPFLEVLRTNGAQETLKLLNQYSAGIQSCFNLNKDQKVFLARYQSQVNDMVLLACNSHTQAQLVANVNCYRDIFSSYDHKINFRQKLQQQQTASIVSKITDLEFSAYLRAGSRGTIVDAAYLIPNEITNKQLYVERLSDIFSLPFMHETQGDKAYVVLQNINLKKIADRVAVLLEKQEASIIAK